MVQKKFAQAMAIEGAMMVRIIDKLVSTGYVERQECSYDCCGKTIHLLSAVSLLLEETKIIVQHLREEIQEHIDVDDPLSCLTTLDTIIKKLIDKKYYE